MFDLARQEAELSNCNFRLGAILIKKKVISRGRNAVQTHPIMQRFGTNASYINSLHAEVSACLRGPKNLEGTVLYVCRLLKNGEFAMAKPCDSCQRILRDFGVREVFYTVNNETYGVWRPHVH